MAKYQYYTNFKETGFEWLETIPEHWKLTYSKWLFKDRNEKAKPSDEMLTASQKYGVIPQKLFMEMEQQKVVLVFKGHDILKHVEKNDFVISMRSFQGGIEYCNYIGAVSSAYVPLEPQGRISSRYFKYLFKSKPYIQALQATTNLVRDGQALRYSNFLQVHIPVLPFEEAEAIGSFLDYETAQIDTLIDKQQTLIQLLKEKRQAVISHAVTKGLNPDAPMKDSGVEWLGEVPEHWKVLKLGNYAIPLNGDRGANYPSGNDFVDEGILFISATQVIDGRVETSNASRITLKKYNQLGGLKIKKGDILYCLRGAGVGKSGICTFDEGTISSSLMGVRATSIDPYYLMLLLNSSVELQQRSVLVTGSVSPNLSAQNVMEYKFAIPEDSEQLKIIAHVKNSLKKIDILLNRAEQAIQLIQERRTALISAAVTGKIDVRGWVAPDASNLVI